jgi:hypothetical protein
LGDSILVYKLETYFMGDFGTDDRFEIHALDDLTSGASDVDSLTGGAEGGGSFDDGGLDVEAVEPVG